MSVTEIILIIILCVAAVLVIWGVMRGDDMNVLRRKGRKCVWKRVSEYGNHIGYISSCRGILRSREYRQCPDCGHKVEVTKR